MVSNFKEIDMSGETTATSFTLDPSKLAAGSVVVLNSATGGPTVTTIEDMKRAIPERQPLVRPCGNCMKLPAQGSTFSQCSRCRETHYCSRGCQVAHWPQHKEVCKDRAKALAQREQAKAAALAEGKVYHDPLVLQEWYRLNNDTVEHAAFHVLELWKGDKPSRTTTHLVLITVEVNETKPDDATLIRYKDAMAAPMEKLEIIGSPPPQLLKRSLDQGFMLLAFIDLKHNLRVLEFHQPPPLEPYLTGEMQPDGMWQVHTVLKMNSHLPSMNT
ncbi:hypothetical protein E1B28_004925 [Marasmius oreades]|uniref:MYND-type domain-containing protein n=1 Tax=Marasmius oreades TaxID=181124 RepID=A0A9P8ADL3_9AGAR|nr:uncharacterized protein E1B28_004925 [Marasmius oreades]KAG7097588.1 hypothetical protein E1B28_004925 [Marasmius oreades]